MFPSYITVQLFPYGKSGHSEETSLKEGIEVGHWRTVSFSLPEGLGDGPLRLDASDFPSIIEITSAEIRAADSGESIWSMTEGSQLKVAGTTCELRAGCVPAFFSSGFDAQLLFPTIDTRQEHVLVELVIRVDTDLERVGQRLQSLERENEDLRQHENDIRTLRQELETAYRERLALVAETKVMAAEKLEAQRERHEIAAAYGEMSRAKEAIEQELRIILGPEGSSAVIGDAGRPASGVYKTELEKIREHAERLEERNARLQSEFNERTGQLQSELERCRTALSVDHLVAGEAIHKLQSELERCETALSHMMASTSWKLTEPLRMIAQVVRRVRS